MDNILMVAISFWKSLKMLVKIGKVDLLVI